MEKAKKRLYIIIAVVVALIIAGVSVAVVLTRDEGEKPDPTKTQIYVAYYNGGLGSQWFDDVKADFEAKYPQYQLMPRPGLMIYDAGTLLNNFDGQNDVDIFFLDYCGIEYFNQFIQKGYAADITEYVTANMNEEFGENTTAADKIVDSISSYYNMDGHYYALPWYQSGYQMIYDVALFEERSLYKDPDGNWNDGSNKSLGQDGLPDTFDDGLPETYSEFFELMDHMVSQQIVPLTFFGTNANYFTSYLSNVFADYEGENDFLINYRLEGNDSDLNTVTLQDAYRVKNGQSGRRYALEFAERIIKGTSYYKQSVFQTTYDNYTMQQDFLMSTERTPNPDDNSTWPVAMMIDGAWWEREAQRTMNDMATLYKNDYYKYGTREFGLMPIPEADDGSSAPGNTTACVSGRSLIFMNNRSDVKDAAGLFLQYMCSNRGLNIATAASGMVRPYEYEMEDEYLAKMTPFGRELCDYMLSAVVVFEEMPLHDFLKSEQGVTYCGYLCSFRSTAEATVNIAQYFLNADSSVQKYLDGMAIPRNEWEAAVSEFLAEQTTN